MKCPHCQKTLWKPFFIALASPHTDESKVNCTTCSKVVKVQLPYYLTASEYAAFGGFVAGTGMAMLLTVDVSIGLRIQLLLSAFMLFTGLIATLTWTNARVR